MVSDRTDATRAYHSPARSAAAAATRSKIVDAAAALFTRDGFQGTTMAAIATAAGVSVQSVHLAGPKSALLMAAFETAFAGDEGSQPLAARPALVEIMSLPDAAEAIDRYVEYIALANERSAGIWEAMRTAAQTDAAMADALADLERRRHGDLAIGAQWFHQRGLLHRRAELGEVADVLGLITAPGTYRHFVLECDWTRDRYQGWMRTAIDRLLTTDD